MQSSNSENQSNQEHPNPYKRYTLGGDDEVIMQTPFDEEDGGSANRVYIGGRGSSCVVIEDGLSSTDMADRHKRVIHNSNLSMTSNGPPMIPTTQAMPNFHEQNFAALHLDGE